MEIKKWEKNEKYYKIYTNNVQSSPQEGWFGFPVLQEEVVMLWYKELAWQ